jgi:hypothetical protein
MLIHRAMTNGTDRMTPGPSASAARNSARITSSNSRLSPESSQFEANVDTYTVTACPCRVRPLWQFLRCDMPYRDRPSHPPSPNTKRSQVNRPDAPDVIWVSVLRRAIGYAAGRPLRVSGRASCRTVPVGGISMSLSNGKHRLPRRNNIGRRYRRRAIAPCPGGHSAPPDLRHLRSRQAALLSPSYFWPVHCRITISRSSDIDDHRQPVNSAALRDSQDSTAGRPATARRQRERKPTDAQ